MRNLPPTRGSHLTDGVEVSPSFPHATNQCWICFGSVHALKTRSRGALMSFSILSLMFSGVAVVMLFLSYLLIDLFFLKNWPTNRGSPPRTCDTPQSMRPLPASL